MECYRVVLRRDGAVWDIPMITWWQRLFGVTSAPDIIAALLVPGKGLSAAECLTKRAIISCPNDHWLYRLTQDMRRYVPIKASDFECIEDLMPQPIAGEVIQSHCAYCGERWRRLMPDGRAQIHFTTGWWPEISAEERG